MKSRYILDENIVICAQLGVDHSGSPNQTCADLVHGIVDICHTIVVDDALWDRYLEQLYRLGNQNQVLGPYLVRVLWNALTTAGKVDGLGHIAPAFDDEHSIPAGSLDDTFVVRLAVESGAALVTTDIPLRNDLQTSGVQTHHNLTVLSPEEAVDQLHPR